MGNAPRVRAADLTAAAGRLFGAVVLDLAGVATGPAVYSPRLQAWAALDGEELGEDDGSLIALVQPGMAADLIAEHGGAGAAAAAVNRRLRAEWTA